MTLKTIYSVDDTYDVHAEADKVFVDILTTMEEPYELTLEAVGDLINALEMAYTDAVDLKDAAEERERNKEWKHLGYTVDDGLPSGSIFIGSVGSPLPDPIEFTLNPSTFASTNISKQVVEALAYAGHNID